MIKPKNNSKNVDNVFVCVSRMIHYQGTNI